MWVNITVPWMLWDFKTINPSLIVGSVCGWCRKDGGVFHENPVKVRNLSRGIQLHKSLKLRKRYTHEKILGQILCYIYTYSLMNGSMIIKKQFRKKPTHYIRSFISKTCPSYLSFSTTATHYINSKKPVKPSTLSCDLP